MKFSIKDFYSKCDQIRSFTADLVTFTEEILNDTHMEELELYWKKVVEIQGWLLLAFLQINEKILLNPKLRVRLL